MLQDITFPKSREYRTGEEFEPVQFFESAFKESTKADILLGYFSFSAIRVLSHGFARFISNGGRLRIIANDVLSSKDKEAILQSRDQHADLIDLQDFDSLRKKLDQYGQHFFECMSYLIAQDRIELVITRPKSKGGISHYKSGEFSDGVSHVTFKGSCNFTASGMIENNEELSAHLSWDGLSSIDRIEDQRAYFNRIYSGEAQFLEYVSVEEVKDRILSEYGGKTLEALEEEAVQLFESKQKTQAVNDEKVEISESPGPRFPFPQGPRDYQKEAYRAWVKNNRKGLFAMATGTGKTITSLNCILEEFQEKGYYRFLVLVPSLPLASQWQKEAADKFGFTEVIICSSRNRGWEDELRTKTKSVVFGNNTNFCAIATYSTFKGERFRSAFFDVLGKQIETVTLIADEAHTMGASGLLKKLPMSIKYRIGLSATPDRVYDQYGSSELESFFDAYSPKFTFRYTMKEAIEKNILCEYDYFPVFFDLTEKELEVYKEYTDKLRKHIDPKTGGYRDNEVVNNLLIQRKNVIHKAKNKLPQLLDIIRSIGPNKFKYAFIYVPEGYEPNYEVVDDFNLSPDDKHLISLYTKYLYENFRFSLKSFTGETKGRDEILELFSNGKYDAVLAMKCLDEGVDVPRAEYAIFCASTGNPRQFVQRRGRVLRSHPKKEKAIIYDLIAAPLIDRFQIDEGQIETERNIFRSEMRRVVNFAALADNCTELIKGDLASVCKRLEIDLTQLLLEELKTYE